MEKKKRHHKGRHKKRTQRVGVLYWIVIAISAAVFCFAGFQLFKIIKGYMDGRSEYERIADLAVETSDEGEKFRVDFDKLLAKNPDTIGWIRFYPEPSIISYPVVQGKDNDEYLHKTFTDNENTLGSIFLDVNSSKDFAGKNSIVYGHRMKDGSMFRHLWDYEDEAFWKENPYFYIYTPDGKELTYHIFAVSKVDALSDAYLTEFADDAAFEQTLQTIGDARIYDTGTEVTAQDSIITLSTCTSASDQNRLIVCGVKEKEAELQEE